MSSYIVDALRDGKHFLDMNWAWKKGCPPINAYFLETWDTKYKYILKKVYNNFMSSPLLVLTCYPIPCMSKCITKEVSRIKDRYVSSYEVCILIYGSTKHPHLLLHYVPDKLVVVDIAHHTYVIGFVADMTIKKKIDWPNFPLHVGAYTI